MRMRAVFKGRGTKMGCRRTHLLFFRLYAGKVGGATLFPVCAEQQTGDESHITISHTFAFAHRQIHVDII